MLLGNQDSSSGSHMVAGIREASTDGPQPSATTVDQRRSVEFDLHIRSSQFWLTGHECRVGPDKELFEHSIYKPHAVVTTYAAHRNMCNRALVLATQYKVGG